MASKKTSVSDRQINTSWLNNAMKSIGISTKNVLKDISPNVYEVVTTGAKTSKTIIQNMRPSNGSVTRVTENLKRNKYVQYADKAYKNILADLASGTLNNVERADKELERSFFGDDADSLFNDSFSFGDEDSFEGSGGDTYQYINASPDIAAIQSSVASISSSIQSGAEAQVKASKATMNATVAISSASMFQLERIGNAAIDHLSNISSSLEAMNQYNNENLTRFIDASMAYYERMGAKLDSAYSDSIQGEKSDPTSVFNNTNGGINMAAYKEYVAKQIKGAFKNSSIGMVVGMIDDDMINMAIANPLGFATEGLVRFMIPKVITNTITGVEETFSAFMPSLLTKLSTWGEEQSTTMVGKLKQYIGKTFGIGGERVTEFDKGATIEKGAVPFDGITKHAITEVITKELREQTAYLKAIANHYKIDTDAARANASVFNYQTGKYDTQAHVTRNIVDDVRNARINSMKQGKFGTAMQNVMFNSNFTSDEQSAISDILDEFMLRLEQHGKFIDLKDNTAGSDINKILGSLSGDKNLVKYFSKYVRNLAEKDDIASMDVNRAIQSAKSASNQRMRMIENDPYYYNLYAADIDGNIDDLILNRQRNIVAGKADDDAYEDYIDPITGKRVRRKKEDRQLKVSNRRLRKKLMPGLYTNTSEDEVVEEPSAIRQRLNDIFNSRISLSDTLGAMATNTGDHLKGGMAAIVHGNSDEAFNHFISMATDQIGILSKSLKDNFLLPLKDTLIGTKDERGYRTGGIFSSVENSLKDGAEMIKWQITGKEYTDSKGIKHDSKEDSVINNLSKIGNTIKTSVSARLFGTDEETGEVDENGNKVIKKVQGVFGSVGNIFKEGFDGWSEALFGAKDKAGQEEVQKKTKEEIVKKVNDAMPAGLTGTILGAGLGAVSGGSLLGTLVGGPIGGAVIGTVTGFASKSERFQNWLFGEKDPETEERKGGFISKPVQKYYEENKKFLVGGASMGAISGAITGGGVLGTLVGGPVAGALIGLGSSVVLKSNMFQEFLFGSEKSGQKGVVNIVKDLFSKHKKSTEKSDKKSITGRTLGMAAIGMSGGAVTATLLSHVGVLGAALTPFGPIGGALGGLALAINAEKDGFHEMLFGTTDEQGNKKEGLLGQFKNSLIANVLDPAKNKIIDLGEEAMFTLKHDVLRKIELTIEPLVNAAGAVISPIIDKAKSFAENVDNVIHDKFITPLVSGVTDYVIVPLRTIASAATSTFFKITKKVVTAPVAVLYKLTSPLARGIAKVTTSTIGFIGKAINFAIITPIKNLFVKPLAMLAKGMFKVISAPFKFIGGVANYINDKRLNIGGDEKEEKDRTGLDNTENSTRRAWAKEDRKIDLLNMRKRQKERKYRDANQQAIAKATGYQRYEDTEENRRLAELATGKKINWHKLDALESTGNGSGSSADGVKIEDIVNNSNPEDLDVETRQLSVLQQILNVLMGKEPNGNAIGDAAASLVDSFIGGNSESEETEDNEPDKKNKSGTPYRTAAREIADDIDAAGGVGKYVKGKATEIVSSGQEKVQEKVKSAKRGINDILSRFDIPGFASGTDNAPKNKLVAVGENGPELMVTNGGEKIFPNQSAIPVYIEGASSNIISRIFGSIASKFKSKSSKDTDTSVDSSDVRSIAMNSENPTATLDSLHGNAQGADQEQLEDDANAIVLAGKAKEKLDAAIDKGLTAEERQKKIKEEENSATLNDIRDTLHDQTDEQRGFSDLWGSIFSKKGLITGLIIAAIPLITKLLKSFGENILSTLGNGFGHLADSIGFVNNSGGLGNGDSTIDKIGENVSDLGESAGKLVSGDVAGAASTFVLGEDGQIDHQSGARAKYLGKGVSKCVSTAVGVADNVTTIAKDVAKTEGVRNKVSKILNTSGTKVVKGATKKGSGNLINKGLDMVSDNWKSLKSGASKAASKTTASETAQIASSKISDKVIGYFKSFVDDVLSKVSKKSGKKIGESVVKNFSDEVCECIAKNFSKISSRVSSVLGVTAGLAVTGVGLLAKEATWITLGAINGLSGAARLFRVDSDKVDALMILISGVFGAFAGSTAGSIVDIVNELVTSVLGVDLFTELATMIYNFLAGEEDYNKLVEGQKDFQSKYESYQTETLTDQYNTMQKAGLLDKSVTLDQYISGAKSGQYASSYASFADYNDEQHQTLGSKVMNGIGGAASTVGKGLNSVKEFFVGSKETTYTDKNGNTYSKNSDGTYQVTSSDGTNLGFVGEEVIDKNTMTETTKRTGNIISRAGNAVLDAGSAIKSGWNTAGNALMDAATGIKNNVEERVKNTAKFASWLLTKDTEEVYYTPDGDFYKSDGTHCNADGDEIGDNIDLVTLSAWIANGTLTKGEFVLRKAGTRQIYETARDNIVGAFKTAGAALSDLGETVKDKASALKDKTVKSLISGADKLDKFLYEHNEKVWFDSDGSYYATDGKGFTLYSMSGDIISDKVDASEVRDLIKSGALKEGYATRPAGITTKIQKTVNSAVEGWKTFTTNAGEFVDSVKDKAVTTYKNVKNTLKTKFDQGVKWLIGNKTKAWYDMKDLSYYVSNGNTFDHYNSFGDLIEEKIDSDRVSELINNGTLKEGTAYINSTLKAKIDDLNKIKSDTFGGLADAAGGIADTIKEEGSNFIASVKENGLISGIAQYFKPKTTKVWYDPNGNYYKLNGSTYDYYNANNDLLASGISAKIVQEKQTAGMLTLGEIQEDSEAKSAISTIQSAVKDAWSKAKETVSNGWESFTNWLTGGNSGGSGTGIASMTTSDYGTRYSFGSSNTSSTFRQFNLSNRYSTVPGGYGGRGNDDTPTTINGHTYYSQNDPRWKDTPYTQPDGSEEKATMGTSGCGPTAFSMVASDLTGRNVSPVETANYAKNAGYRDDTGTNWSFIDNASKAYNIPSNSIYRPDPEYVKSELENGNQMILSGTDDGTQDNSAYTKAGHYVVAVGTDNNGNAIINDPRGKEYSKKISIGKLTSQTGAAWSFGGNGKGVRRRIGKQQFGGRGVTLADCREAVVGWMLSIIGRNTYTQSGSRTKVLDGVNGHGYGDCSATCWKVYEKALGSKFQIGTWTGGQYNNSMGTQVGSLNSSNGTYPDTSKMLPGDLVFFYARGASGKVGHVEMYIGNGYLAGHGSGTGPTIHTVKKYTDGRVKSGYGTWYKVVRFITDANLPKVTLTKPNPSNYKVANQYTDGNGNSSDGTVVDDTTGASADSTTSSTSSALSGVDALSGFMTEVANRAYEGLLSGNYDSDYSSYFYQTGDSTSDTSTTSSTSGFTGSTNAEKVWSYFKNKGIPAEGIAGLMGNLYHESGIDPQNVENFVNSKLGVSDSQFTSNVDNGTYDKNKFLYPTGGTSKSGYGLAQWTWPDRKGKLYDQAKSKGVSIGDIGMQLDYLYDELSTKYQSVLNAMKSGESVRSVSDVVLKKFEAPADQSSAVQSKRAKKGQEYYDKFKNWNPSSSSGGNGNNYPKYTDLTDDQKLGIAKVITQETGGSDEVAAKQEASQMANLNEVQYKKSATGENIYNTVAKSGWYAGGVRKSTKATNVAKQAVNDVLVNGKRTLPRYVVEHDTFPTDIVNAKARSEYKKGDSVKNRYGSNYKFYTFFGKNKKGDISGYFQKYYDQYKSDVPWGGGSGDGIEKASPKHQVSKLRTPINISKPKVGGKGSDIATVQSVSSVLSNNQTYITDESGKQIDISKFTASSSDSNQTAQYLAYIVKLLSDIAGNTLSTSEKLELLKSLNTAGVQVFNGGNSTKNYYSTNTAVGGASQKTSTNNSSRNSVIAKQIAQGV